MIDKDELKISLSIDDVFQFVEDLGGEPRYESASHSYFISKTICHNKPDELDEASHKLYYYDNTHLFHCYTGCGDTSFDIYQLVLKMHKDWTLSTAIFYVAKYFGQDVTYQEEDNEIQLPDWEILRNFVSTTERYLSETELKAYDGQILTYLPKPQISPWIHEGIGEAAIKEANICYNPVNQSIVIPHYDINNRLVGIRERALIKKDEQYGKYRPAYLYGTMYSHPLGFNLYNLNNSKSNIGIMRRVVIFESEKSTLKYRTYFPESDISVACCGSNLTTHQLSLLLEYGVTDILVAFDRQYKYIGDAEYKVWMKKLTAIKDKCKNYCTIEFLLDRRNLLDYKDAPIDKGKEIYLKLYKERITL